MKQCLARIKRRPAILLLMSLVALPLCAFEQFNSVSKDFGSFSVLFKEDFMTTLSNIADGIVSSWGKLWIFFLTMGVSVVFVLALSVLIGLFMSGYYQNMYLAVIDAPVKKGDFRMGINRHFAKMTGYSLLLISSLFLVALMILFSVVPFAMHLEMFLAGDTSVIFKTLLLAVVTVLFGFFTIVFYSMYMSYMVPSLIGFKKGGVLVSLKMTNGYCWYLMPRTTLFLFAMLLEKAVLLTMGYGTANGSMIWISFAINWIFTTVAFFAYSYYVFNTFTIMKDDMFTEKAE